MGWILGISDEKSISSIDWQSTHNIWYKTGINHNYNYGGNTDIQNRKTPTIKPAILPVFVQEPYLAIVRFIACNILIIQDIKTTQKTLKTAL